MIKGKIQTTYNKAENQIIITADAEGLRYLADVCLRIIGKESPAGHFHLMERMENLEKGSIDLTIAYRDSS